jgi:hypothetical protein
MSAQIGLWIDHREAILVTVTEKGGDLARIPSNAEKQLRRGGDAPLEGAHESNAVPADDGRLRAYTGQLNAFYDAVIARLGDAISILILGPGEAKTELKARLDATRSAKRFLRLETADKMSDRQIMARVKLHFAG